jgi:hypothetical protein
MRDKVIMAGVVVVVIAGVLSIPYLAIIGAHSVMEDWEISEFCERNGGDWHHGKNLCVVKNDLEGPGYEKHYKPVRWSGTGYEFGDGKRKIENVWYYNSNLKELSILSFNAFAVLIAILIFLIAPTII